MLRKILRMWLGLLAYVVIFSAFVLGVAYGVVYGMLWIMSFGDTATVIVIVLVSTLFGAAISVLTDNPPKLDWKILRFLKRT